MLQYRGIIPRFHAEDSKTGKLDGWLATEHTDDNRIVQVVVAQEARPAHDPARFGTLASARSRWTTGLGL